MSEEETKQEPLFDRLSKIDVNKFTEKKNGLTYLSWAHAWRLFKQHAPDATYEIHFDAETRLPYMESPLGFMCYTTVTAEGETHGMWLPVMDGANKAQKQEAYTYKTKWAEKECDAADMFDVNKTIMRCLVKNLAMFGLGIYIYAGEDIPESDDKPEPTQPSKPTTVATPKPKPEPKPFVDRNKGCKSWRDWKTEKGARLEDVVNDPNLTKEQKTEGLEAIKRITEKLISKSMTNEEQAVRERDLEWVNDAIDEAALFTPATETDSKENS